MNGDGVVVGVGVKVFVGVIVGVGVWVGVLVKVGVGVNVLVGEGVIQLTVAAWKITEIPAKGLVWSRVTVVPAPVPV